MRRVQIRLDPAHHEALRRRAAAEGKSLAAIVRQAVAAYLGRGAPPIRRLTLSDMTFIGSGRSRGPGDIAVNHDKYLAEDFLK